MVCDYFSSSGFLTEFSTNSRWNLFKKTIRKPSRAGVFRLCTVVHLVSHEALKSATRQLNNSTFTMQKTSERTHLNITYISLVLHLPMLCCYPNINLRFCYVLWARLDYLNRSNILLRYCSWNSYYWSLEAKLLDRVK